ncbi:MAG: serine hydrolase [Siphonobacter sp.]
MSVNRRVFLQQLGISTLQLGIISSLPAWKPSPLGLPRSTPEAQGIASDGILNFIKTIESEKLNVHSLMVLRHGQVIAEGWWAPYAPTLKHTLYSLSKSFTSTAIGIAVDEKRLHVDDKIISFFPEDAPPKVSPNLATMRVKDLLTMSTGHATDTTPAIAATQNWVKAFFEQPVEYQPGTHFLYNSGATYMLSALIQKLTGQTLLEYLTPRLFRPLSIEGADWEVDPKGINTGGWGLRVKTEDIARFGQMYLQKGIWKGKRIVSENWVNDATTFEIQSAGGTGPKETNDWLQGYGYQFWRCRHEGYRGDGAFGQYCIVIPDQDLVLAMTSETANMQGIMDAAWNHILPAIGSASNLTTQTQLRKKLISLTLPRATGSLSSSRMPQLNGKTIQLQSNDLGVTSLKIAFSKAASTLVVSDTKGPHILRCGLGQWLHSTTNLSVNPLKLIPTPVPGETDTKIAASGAWKDDQTFFMIIRFIETAHYEIISLHFDSSTVQVRFQRSIDVLAGKADDRPALEGKLT